MFEVESERQVLAISDIRLVAVGGGAGTVLSRLLAEWPDAPPACAVNTDARALAATEAPSQLQVGEADTNGLGTGGDAALGRAAAEKDGELIRGLFDDVRVALVTVCLGGGTGSGIAPFLVRAARDSGALTLCVATLPFAFEGPHRTEVAEKALSPLRKAADGLIVIPNDRVAEGIGDDATLEAAFEQVDAVVSAGVGGVWKMLTRPGVFNLDFADLRRVLRCGELGAMGCATGRGKNRAASVASAVLKAPLLDHGAALADATCLLVGIEAGDDLMLREIDHVTSTVRNAARPDARLLLGVTTDPGQRGGMTVTVICSTEWNDSKPGDAAAEGEAAPASRSGGGRVVQPSFNFETPRKGRFKGVEPTRLRGEDLDIPTFIRRGVTVER